jgi:Bacteriophage HK97-gp10, putative tail-component
MANSGGDALHSRIAENTPVHTGNLRTSWYRVEAVGLGDRYESWVRTEVDYAPYVNYGTGLWGPEHRKYEIKPIPPNQTLSWFDPGSGGRVYARSVWHSGSPPAHMVESGAAKVEAEIGMILDPDLQLFKAEMEALALKAQARTSLG